MNVFVSKTWKPMAGIGGLLTAREIVGRRREESVAGQTALVTGGSRGLGLAIAEKLLSEGCRVAICARDPEELERARTQLAPKGDVLTRVCDVGNQAEVAALISAVTEDFGRIDILVNNAGIITVAPLEAVTMEDFEQTMQVMYWGVVYPSLEVLPQMKARGAGRIVNITSFGGRIAAPHFVPYSAAKAAATAFSDGLRAELLSEGISVTTVMPGEMRTGSHLHARFGGNRDAEYRWFAIAATLPTTTSAGRAARHIVRATKRRQALLVFPWTFSLLLRAQGLAPGLTANVLTLAKRALPANDGSGPGTIEGREIEPEVKGPLWNVVTAAGRATAERYNEITPPPVADTSGAAVG